ncbi:hypothetical protein H7097_00355 [Aeromicrobium sp.]|nr:hypothetical protein [Candidatus Saccharibacteria bacterium]
MRLIVLYRPQSEFSRVVEEFIENYKRRHEGERLEIVNYDSRDGSATASLYDIMQQPAILALREDGSVLKTWEGSTMPLMDEVASYTYS